MRTRIAIVLTCTALTACGGLREALTDHIDTVARTGSSRLSVDQLAALFAHGTISVEPTTEHAAILTNIWVDYHRVAYAAAHGDSLVDVLDAAMAPMFNNELVRLYQDSLRNSSPVDSANQAGYDAGTGGLYAARHILLKFPDSTGTPCSPPCPSAAQRDSVRRAAQALAGQVTNANFADMAKAHPGDPGSAARGGSLGVFAKEEMVPEFGNATAALKPGEISGAVESPYGEHIIQRRTFADVRDEYVAAFNRNATRMGERTLRDRIDKESSIVVRPDASTLAKAAARSVEDHRTDATVLATFTGGSLNVGQFLGWVQARPGDEQLQQQIAAAPDSMVARFVKDIAVQQVLLMRAVAAGIRIPAQEKQTLYDQFRPMFAQVQQQLGVSPQQLGGGSVADREAVASRRVDALIAQLMTGQGSLVQVPVPLRTVLDVKYPTKVHPAALDRVAQVAIRMQASMPTGGQPSPRHD